MKILVACNLPESTLSELRTLGTEIIYEPKLTTAELEKRIDDVAVLVVGRLRVPPEVVTAGTALQLIVRAGSDTANIAIETASEQGVFVCNCPDKQATAVAELTLGLLVALDRRVLKKAAVSGRSVPDELDEIDAIGLAGRTLGVLGFGAAEREIIKRAQAFDMEILAWSPTLTPELAGTHQVGFCTWPRELARRSDMVTVYAPQEEADEILVNAEFLQTMRSGAYIVYIGHPAALDQAALVEIAGERKLRIAYDVSTAQLTSSKTEQFRTRLQALPDVIGTHRLAHRTKQAYEATADELVRVIREFLVGGEVLNCVNLLARSPATWQLFLRLKDTVGVLAAIMENIRADGVNAEEITSRVFTGAKAGCCTIALDERPSTEALSAIRQLKGVLHLELRALV